MRQARRRSAVARHRDSGGDAGGHPVSGEEIGLADPGEHFACEVDGPVTDIAAAEEGGELAAADAADTVA